MSGRCRVNVGRNSGCCRVRAGILTYVVMAVVFFSIFGFGEPVLYWVFLGTGLALVVQGLLTFEIIRFPFQDWEKRIAEKRLGRKL